MTADILSICKAHEAAMSSYADTFIKAWYGAIRSNADIFFHAGAFYKTKTGNCIPKKMMNKLASWVK